MADDSGRPTESEYAEVPAAPGETAEQLAMRDKYYAGSGTLKRSLRLFYVYAIATGAIFTFMAYWDGFFLTTTGPFTFIGFALMMVAVLPIGFVYAEWSVMCPTAGVELVYGTVGLNKHAGFWSTWLILAAWLAVPPAGVLGIVSWVNYMFKLDLSVGWIALISCILLSLYTLLSLQNVTISGQVQSFMLIFGIVVCVIGSILWITSSAWSWDNFHPFIHSGLSAHFGIPAAVIGVALLVTPYFGFEIVPNMVEEGDFPIKKQNQAILGSIITCGLLYVFYFFALSGMDTWANLTGNGTGQPFASLHAFRDLMGDTGFWAVWLWIFGIGAALFPITTSVLGFWLSSVRMMFAMGRQNFLPKAFAKTNRHHQPILPNLLILGISLAAIITMNYTTFLQNFFTLMAFAAATCYAIISLAAIVAAVKHPDWERPYKIPGGMFMRVLSLIISVAFAFLTALGQAGYTVMLEYLGLGLLLWIWMLVWKWRKEPVWMETPDGIKEY
jgi:basic amino acid/polyamine antiporter, APA family